VAELEMAAVALALPGPACKALVAGWAGLALWLISLFWFWSRLSAWALRAQQVPPVQSIVVLGSGTLDGHPRPVLAARLDRAAQLASCSPRPVAVCGGVDWGEKEAEVMARYLQQRHGIAAAAGAGKLSTSTELNLKLSRPLLAERGVAADAPMAMVSSDFHLMRAMDIAKQDLPQVYPVAAPNPLATRFNAWLREYFAMASSWLLGEV
jgi:uncharacterized SAM-binding protein YcdF (DUF218 family)